MIHTQTNQDFNNLLEHLGLTIPEKECEELLAALPHAKKMADSVKQRHGNTIEPAHSIQFPKDAP